MVNYDDTALDDVFGALADATRRALLVQLREGPATVSDLARPHDITIQGVSKHIKKLERAGLIRRRRSGREVWCEAVIEPMQKASSWLENQRRFWEVRLERLEVVLKEEHEKQDREGHGAEDR